MFPKVFITLTSGAAELVVHEAFEIIVSLPSKISSFTPITTDFISGD